MKEERGVQGHPVCLSIPSSLLISPQSSHLSHPSLSFSWFHLVFSLHILYFLSSFLFPSFFLFSLLFSLFLLCSMFSFSLLRFYPSICNFSFLSFLPSFPSFSFGPLCSVCMTHFLGPGPINHSVVGSTRLPPCLAALPHHRR